MPIGVPAIMHIPDPNSNVTGKYILVVNANNTDILAHARKYLFGINFREGEDLISRIVANQNFSRHEFCVFFFTNFRDFARIYFCDLKTSYFARISIIFFIPENKSSRELTQKFIPLRYVICAEFYAEEGY